MSLKDQKLEVYHIPANYTDSGALLGGMLKIRNAVETLVVAGVLGYIEVFAINMEMTPRIVLVIFTLIPICIITAIGINGDSLLEFVSNYFKFLSKRKILRFRRLGRYAKRTKNAN